MRDQAQGAHLPAAAPEEWRESPARACRARTRVAFVAQPSDAVVPPRQNSVGLIAYNTAMAMADRADAVIVASGSKRASTAGAAPVDVRFVHSRLDANIAALNRTYPRWAKRFGLARLADAHIGYVRGAARELKRAQVQVVHVMNYWPMCRALRRASRGAKVVLEMHSEWLSQMDRARVSRQLAAVDCVVAVSDHVAALFRAAYPEFRGSVATVHNGVDAETFRPLSIHRTTRRQEEGPRLLYVGRVSPEKGVHTLIEAFGEVVLRYPGATLELVGTRNELPKRFLIGLSADPMVRALGRFYDANDIPQYQRVVDELVRKCGVEERVSFAGGLPHQELVRKYQSADIVVNPSVSESFGMSVLEGMACGLPVIGTAVGGMKETVVDGTTGLLVPAENHDALARAILEVWKRPATAGRMGIAGRQRAVADFSWGARASRLLAVYRAIGAS